MEVLDGSFKSVSTGHYVLNDPEKLSGKYISARQNLGVNITENMQISGKANYDIRIWIIIFLCMDYRS